MKLRRPVIIAKCLMALHALFLATILTVIWQARHGADISASLVAVLGLICLVVQFSWSFAVGLYVGPGSRRRPLLWASLLTVFLPIALVRVAAIVAWFVVDPLVAVCLLMTAVIVLACETWAGVLQGLKIHVTLRQEKDL